MPALKFILLLMAILVLASLVVGLAYSSTQNDNQGNISGWVIRDIHYQLKPGTNTLRSVEFDLDRPAASIWVSFEEHAADYFRCSNITAYHWVCDVPGIEIDRLKQLRMTGTGK